MSAFAFGLRSRLLLKLTGLARLAADHEAANRLPAGRFEDRALQILGIPIEARGLDHVPRTGPLVIVANHPHGALDGLALLSAVRTTRTDVRLIANHLLARIPELHDSCFFIDPFGGPAAAERSRSGLRSAHLWLRRGGALIIFPSGEVAHRRAIVDHTPCDSDWHSTAGRLAEAANARVVPASIRGRNSRLFYAAGRLHPALRTALLPRELLRKRGTTVRISFHAPLARHRRVAPVVPEVDRAALAENIRRLLPARCLVDADPFAVYCAPAQELPAVLREIGRLREVTYRLVGEGTGQSIDLDPFDRTYLHLFTWDRRAQCVVGAYRLAPTDRILASQGVDGLYTRRLFRYDAQLFERLPPAIELGRSFVRAEYQRHYTALLLLWKGIGQYVVRNPRYRVLFGPVSISTRYSDVSHRLLMAFLFQNHRHAELSALVQAINPMNQSPALPRGVALPSNLAETERLLNEFEGDGKGIPILLRQYLKLNARVLGFNVDPEFGDALDALMMVDLMEVEPAILRRYFGREGAEQLIGRCVAA